MKNRILKLINLVILFMCFFGFVKVEAQTSFSVSNQTTGDTLLTVDNSGRLGLGITTPSAGLHMVNNNGALFSGTFGVGSIPAEGAGTRMMWYPAKSAFRVGSVNLDQWNDANIGEYSIAMGRRTTASGAYAQTYGNFSTASGDHSMAFGRGAVASGVNAISIGRSIEAAGDYSIAIGVGEQTGTVVSQDTTLVIYGGRVGIHTVSPTSAFEVADTIYSSFGGFKFPDGTVQETAVLGGGVSGINDLSDAINDSSSIFLGTGAGANDDSTDNGNTGIGTDALNSNINGWRNTAIGLRALYSNVSGYNNTATGMNAMDLNTTGDNNTANGSWALHSNTDGNLNTGVGNNALYSNTSGDRNTAVGYDALRDNTTGNDNIAVGYSALSANTVGEENTAIGQFALYRNNNGNYNTAFGYGTLSWNSSASGNSAFGHEALNSNTTGYGNTAIGRQALLDNTTGNHNTAIGNYVMLHNTEGDGNTATGHLTLSANIDGGGNTGTGLQALWRNTSGSTNTATGSNSLSQNTSGSSNTATGVSSLNRNTTGFRNIGIGTEANFYNQEGSYNTIIGAHAGHGSSDHNKNRNVFIGYMAGYDEIGDDKLYIENSNSSSPLIGGDFAADEIYLNGHVGIGTTNPLSTLSVGSDGNADATIFGETASSVTFSAGVRGYASNSGTVTNCGGYFEAAGSSGRGVNAVSTGTSGIGVFGSCFSGRGIYGGSFSGTGVYGFVNGTSGVGVRGVASHATGTGVIGDGQAYDFDAVGPGVNYGTTSSIRWKKNIIEIDNPLVKINQLRGVYFDWDQEHGGGHDVGCIAEEVGEVLPEIVVYEENGVDADGMDYSKLTPLLIEAVKAQQKIIEELKNRIEKLENKN